MWQTVGENASDVEGMLTTTASSSGTGDSFTDMDKNTASDSMKYRVGSCPSCGYCQHCGRGGHQPPYDPGYFLPYFVSGTATCDTSPAYHF